MRVENPDLYRHKITRRQALMLGVGGLAALYADYKIRNGATSRFLPPVPEAEDIESDQAEAGVVVIYKGANIRTAPVIPGKTRFRKPENTIKWEQIETVNGVSLSGKSAFLALNPSVVVGQNAYPNYDSDYRNGFYWFKLMVKEKGETDAKLCYINRSYNTEDFVQLLGYAGYVDIETGKPGTFGGMFLIRDEILAPEDISRVIVPENLESMAGDTIPKLWSERMRKQFEGQIPLVGRLTTKVKAIAAGGEKEVAEMLQQNIPINVREYPSLEYGNGEHVKVVGRVAQGTMINRVLLPPDDLYHFDFAAVLSEDLNGSLVDAQGNSVVPSSGRVYAIAKPYMSEA
jgi:hypothetical protein